jgi:hypothetical protein
MAACTHGMNNKKFRATEATTLFCSCSCSYSLDPLFFVSPTELLHYIAWHCADCTVTSLVETRLKLEAEQRKPDCAQVKPRPACNAIDITSGVHSSLLPQPSRAPAPANIFILEQPPCLAPVPIHDTVPTVACDLRPALRCAASLPLSPELPCIPLYIDGRISRIAHLTYLGPLGLCTAPIQQKPARNKKKSLETLAP